MGKYFYVDNSNRLLLGIGLLLIPLVLWMIYHFAFSNSTQMANEGVPTVGDVIQVSDLSNDEDPGPFRVTYLWTLNGTQREQSIMVRYSLMGRAPYRPGDQILLLYDPNSPTVHEVHADSDPRIWNYGVIISVLCALLGLGLLVSLPVQKWMQTLPTHLQPSWMRKH